MSNKQKRLFVWKEQMDSTAHEDHLYAAAYMLESVLIEAGAEAGTDYTYLDLLKQAQPLALDGFRKPKGKGKDLYRFPTDYLHRPAVI